MTTNQNPELGRIITVRFDDDGLILDQTFSSATATTVLQVFTEFSQMNEGITIHRDAGHTTIELSDTRQAVDMFNYLVEVEGRENKHVKEFIDAVKGMSEFTVEEEEVDEVIEFTDTVDIFLKEGEVVDAGFYMFLEAFSVEHSIESNELLGGGTRVRLRGFYDLPEAYERFIKQGRKIVVQKPTPATIDYHRFDATNAFQTGCSTTSFKFRAKRVFGEIMLDGHDDKFYNHLLTIMTDEKMFNKILDDTWKHLLNLVAADLIKYGYFFDGGTVHYVHTSEQEMDEGMERVKLFALIAASEQGNMDAARAFFNEQVEASEAA